MTASINEKIEQIKSFTASTDVEQLIVTIVERLGSLPRSQTEFMSYVSIANIADVKSNDANLIKCITILSSEVVNVIKTYFVYVSKTTSESHTITSDEFSLAVKRGFFVDPYTGEKDADFAKSTFAYFSTSEEFSALQAVK